MNNRILTGTSTFASYDETPLKRLTDNGCEVVLNPYKRKLNKQEILELLPNVTGLIAGLEPLDEEVLRSSQLKVISRVGSGISNVDLEAARDLGIQVYCTPDAPTNAVAELTIAGMLSCLRQIPQMDHDLHQGHWNRQNGYQLEGKNVLIIGYGRIGRRVAELLQPFNVQILVCDPFLEDTSTQNFTLEDALPQADIITFHCSGEECLLDADKFRLLKDGAIICNSARGSLVSEAALIDALGSGRVRSCWLDTFEQEPYGGKLTTIPQAILTPHVGSFTRECRIKMELQAVENLLKGLK